jgi:ABC-type nickel/cobalt efflux system permease component RcnA
MIEVAFFAVAVIGLLHGLEPGHGWPVAVLYSIRTTRPVLRALLSSSVISAFHLTSSIAVVAIYVFLKAFWSFSLPYVNYLAGAALAILGVRFLSEKPSSAAENHGHFHEDFGPGEYAHEHEHPSVSRHAHPHRHTRRLVLSLSGIAVFAFVLGFAHDEEFALLALAVGGIDPLALMLVYASAVTIGLVGITLISVRIFARFQHAFRRYEFLLPRVTGLVLLAMAGAFLLGLR